ncbi:MAG: hypothetical protein JSU07_03290 [Bacteroidetes bacterium]|nr:hypothetical protein [Bacteroidota bacterium]
MQVKIFTNKPRNFGQVFGDAFTYIRQNFKSLLVTIILYNLPAVALIAYFFMSMFNFYTSLFSYSSNQTTKAIEILFISLGLFVMLTLMSAIFLTVINKHLVLNQKNGTNEYVKRSDLLPGIFREIWVMILNIILFGVVFLLIVSVVFFIIIGILSLSFSAGFFGVLFSILIGLCLYLIALPILAYIFVNVFYVSYRNKINAISALFLVIKTIKGNFWSSWGTSFISGMITYFLSAFSILPLYILFFFQLFSRSGLYTSANTDQISVTTLILGSLLFVFAILINLCLVTIFHIMCVFHHTSCEEKKEGNLILEKINQL